MSEVKTYTGGCHCGRVSFETDADVSHVVSCNCSICRKRGTLMAFVGEDQFRLKSGADTLTDYQFNKHVIHHLFCPTCGISSFARGTRPDGAKMVALNVRCLDGVDLDALQVRRFDGAKL